MDGTFDAKLQFKIDYLNAKNGIIAVFLYV